MAAWPEDPTIRQSWGLYVRLHSDWPPNHPAFHERWKRTIDRVPVDERERVLSDLAIIGVELQNIEAQMTPEQIRAEMTTGAANGRS